jgi:hypothetical protein
MARYALVLAVLFSPQESPRARELWERLGPLFTPPDTLRGELGTLRPVVRFEDGKRSAATPAEWQERRAEIVKKWTDLLGPWPPLLEKPVAQEQWKESVDGFTRRRIDLEIAPGRKTGAFLLTPEGKGPFAAVIDVFYYPEDGAGMKADRRQQNDFGYQAVRRGMVALCVGQNPTPPRDNADLYYPSWTKAELQPLSYLAYVAANAHTFLSQRPEIDPARIGVVGHSYGGKWSLFAGALYEKFAAVATSDPGIVFDEARPNVNYWEPWYLGYEPGTEFRKRGVLTPESGRKGPYRTMIERGMDLHELHSLIAPRPFFVAGGSEDQVARWTALNHTVGVNRILGQEHRVGMHNRPEHKITPEASERVADFFEYFLKEKKQ